MGLSSDNGGIGGVLDGGRGVIGPAKRLLFAISICGVSSSVGWALMLLDSVEGYVNLPERLFDTQFIFHKCDSHISFAIGAKAGTRGDGNISLIQKTEAEIQGAGFWVGLLCGGGGGVPKWARC